MAKQILLATSVLAAVLLSTSVQAGVIDYDQSPGCQPLLPRCQAQCKAANKDFIFVCSAGSGANGGQLVRCDCFTPALPAGGDQTARLQLAPNGFPGAKICKQKTWVNDCGNSLIAQFSGSQATFTPTITSAFGNPCNPVSGIVTSGNQVAVAWPEYPLGQMTGNPDGSVSVQFGPFEDGSSGCFAIYQVVAGTFPNRTATTAGLGLPGALGAPGAGDGTAAQTAETDLGALLNSGHSVLPSLFLSSVTLLVCLLASMQLL